jgi:hypothetical protein
VNNLNLVRGLCLMAIALLFGTTSFKYNIGEFGKAGPGLFPLLMSCFVFLIGVVTVVRARFVERVPLRYDVKNIALVLLGLCGFALISEFLDMIAGILWLVFITGFANKEYSIVRNLKISAGLIVVGFLFRYLLGLQLPLI